MPIFPFSSEAEQRKYGFDAIALGCLGAECGLKLIMI
jgi:hypothetical protein